MQRGWATPPPCRHRVAPLPRDGSFILHKVANPFGLICFSLLSRAANSTSFFILCIATFKPLGSSSCFLGWISVHHVVLQFDRVRHNHQIAPIESPALITFIYTRIVNSLLVLDTTMFSRSMQRSGPRGPKRSPTPTSAGFPNSGATNGDPNQPPSPISTSPNPQKPLYLCSPFVEAALVKGNFKTIVMLPKYVDVTEWVAVNSEFYFSSSCLLPPWQQSATRQDRGCRTHHTILPLLCQSLTFSRT